MGEDAVWVAGGTAVWRFDPATNAVTATIAVPGGADHVATGDGGVWVTGTRSLSRIDPRTGQVTGDVPLGDPHGLAVGHGSVWVADHAEGGMLRRISAGNLRLEASIKVPGLPNDDLDLPENPSHVAIGEGGVWVADSVRGHMSRLDPDHNRFTLTMSRLGLETSDLAIGKGWLWWVNPSELSRAKPADPSDEIAVSTRPVAVAVGRWAVWVVGEGGDGLSIVDPETGRETLVGQTEEPAVDVAVGFDSVWVLGGRGLLSRYTETGPKPGTTGG